MISWKAPVCALPNRDYPLFVGERSHKHCECMAILISIQYFAVLILSVPFSSFAMQYFIT